MRPPHTRQKTSIHPEKPATQNHPNIPQPPSIKAARPRWGNRGAPRTPTRAPRTRPRRPPPRGPEPRGQPTPGPSGAGGAWAEVSRRAEGVRPGVEAGAIGLVLHGSRRCVAAGTGSRRGAGHEKRPRRGAGAVLDAGVVTGCRRLRRGCTGRRRNRGKVRA